MGSGLARYVHQMWAASLVWKACGLKIEWSGLLLDLARHAFTAAVFTRTQPTYVELCLCLNYIHMGCSYDNIPSVKHLFFGFHIKE